MDNKNAIGWVIGVVSIAAVLFAGSWAISKGWAAGKK